MDWLIALIDDFSDWLIDWLIDCSLDVLATVLEEMPPFPEKESNGILNLLKKKRPGRVPENPGQGGPGPNPGEYISGDVPGTNIREYIRG